MKKKQDDFFFILLIVIFLFSTFFLGYSSYSQIFLAKNHEEIKAKITDVIYTDERRHHYCTVYFEYEENNLVYENSAQFNRTILDRIKDTISDKYIANKEVVVFKNGKGDFQLENEINSEIMFSMFYTLLSFSFLIFIIILFLQSDDKSKSKEKDSFYIQNNDYEIKDIHNVKDIRKYLKMLKNEKIICFGFNKKNFTYEYSFLNGKIFERKIDKNNEVEKEIKDEKIIIEKYTN